LIVLRWAVREKNKAEQALLESGLDYVIIRPGWMNDDPATGDVLVAESSKTMTGSIPRADVARLMVASLFAPDVVNRTFEVVARTDAKAVASPALVDSSWALQNGPVETSSEA
jgi:uncharacterized protein YbjT (DUF2867 family)